MTGYSFALSGRRGIQAAVMAGIGALLFHAVAIGQSVPDAWENSDAPGVSATQGTRLGWEVRSGIGYTDNLFIDPSPKQEETIASAGLALRGQHVGRRLKAQIDADAAYFDYLEGLAESEVIGEGRGELIFGLIPNRFEWNIGDDFGQSRPSQFEAVTPANREYVNHFFTGPRLAVRLMEGLDLTGSGEFRNTRYETSPFDGDRYFGAAGLRRRFSQHRALFALASSEKFEFDQLSSGEDFKRNEYFIRFHSAAARGGFVADAGYTSLGSVNGATADNKGTLFRLSANRAVSRHGSVAISAGKEFSTSSDLFAPRGDAFLGANLAGEQAFSAATPFEQRFVAASWSFTRLRTSLRAATRFAKEEYSVQGLPLLPNRDTLFWALSADRRLSPLTSLSVELSGGKDDYETDTTLDASEFRAAARAMHSLGRMLRLSLELSYLDRSDANGDARELRGFLLLSYGRGMNTHPLRRIGAPDSGAIGDIGITE